MQIKQNDFPPPKIPDIPSSPLKSHDKKGEGGYLQHSRPTP